MNTQIDNLLLERQVTHGKFSRNAEIAYMLKQTVTQYSDELDITQLEALYQICNKMARILNGGEKHKDSWMDIAGYAKLGENVIDGIDL